MAKDSHPSLTCTLALSCNFPHMLYQHLVMRFGHILLQGKYIGSVTRR